MTDLKNIRTEHIDNIYVRVLYKDESYVGIQTAVGVGEKGEQYAFVLPRYVFMKDEVEEITQKEYFLGKLQGHECAANKLESSN